MVKLSKNEVGKLKKSPFLLMTLMLLIAAASLASSGFFFQEYPPQQPTQPQGQSVSPDESQQPLEQQGQKLFFYKDGQLAPIERQVTGGAQMVGFAMQELMKGPSDQEKAEGYSTEIPEGVRMLYYTESNDGKTFGLDLSEEISPLSNDPARAEKALDQIIRTAQDITGAENINMTTGGTDIWEALGVSKVQAEQSEKSSSNRTIILGIVLGVVVISALAAFLLLYWRRRRGKKMPEDRGKMENRKKARK